ncbi:histidine phosphatase family protein [Sulfitobacter sp. BDSS02]|nr:histidine phosphatase family protein [Sulfitobacter sp. BDSS02]MBR9850192.1 histidine phosphatase family protein [Paracoccaceae bacterium]
MIRLALLRHGPTEWNRMGRIQGRSDIALDDQARLDLGALRLPGAWEKAELWSSPLARARDTASCLTGRMPQISDALIEMNWGRFEGQKGAELIEDPESDYRHIEDWGWDYCPPDGESPKMVSERLDPWLDGLTRDAVAVCHIGVMRVLLARAHGWDFIGPAPFRIKRNRLYILTLDEGLSADPEPLRLISREAGA